jgi:hypothetical protein
MQVRNTRTRMPNMNPVLAKWVKQNDYDHRARRESDCPRYRPQSELLTHLFVSMGYRLREAIRALSDLIESRFAAFAGVPYEDPLSQQQWEQLWETELELSEWRASR